MKKFFYQKVDDIYFDHLTNSYQLLSKKSICLSSKVDFFAVDQVSNVITLVGKDKF